MSWNDTLLEDAQEDVKARLENDTFFADIPVLLQRKGDIESDVENALGVLNEKSGKCGICAVVLMPEVEAPDGELPGPELTVIQSVQIIERPIINQDALSGTGKSAERVALNVANLLHRYIAFHLGWTMMAHRKPIRPLGSEPGLVQYLVVVLFRTGLTRTNQVRQPEAAKTGSNLITLTCATYGAAIYYTTDGSYPGPANSAATLYSAPFTPASGVTLVRAGATKTGYIPSNTIAVDIYEGTILSDDEGQILTDDGGTLHF